TLAWRKRIAAQTTFWKRRRFRRWMRMGTAMAARPASRIGLRKLTSPCRRSEPECEIRAEHFLERLRGVHQRVMALILFATVAQAPAEPFDFAQVALPDFRRARADFRDGLEALELHQAAEGELQLVRVHDMENDHFIPAEAQVLDAVEHLLLIV